MRANRIVITHPGPPSVLRYEQYDVAAPGRGEVLIRQTAIGLNYIDIQHRTGRYPSIARRYPLNAAVQAHEDLQARRTTGVSVLVPAECS